MKNLKSGTGLILAVLLLVGAGLRFWYAWSHYDIYRPLIEDEEGYYEVGIDLLDCHVLSAGIPDIMPRTLKGALFPSFIALAEGATRHHWPGHIRLLQALLSSLEIGMLYILGAWIMSPLAGVLAAAWATFDPEQVASVVSLNVHGFYGFCLLVVLVAVLRWMDKRSVKSTVFLGLVLAASLLCRSTHFLLPVFLCAAYLFWWKFPERPWKNIAVLTVATAVFMSPIIVRNALQFKKFIPSDGYGAAGVLLRGSTGPYWSCTRDQAIELAESLQPGFKALDLKGNDFFEALLRLAFKNIRAHPLSYAWFCLQRLALFWRALLPGLLLGLWALWSDPKNRRLQAAWLTLASLSGYAIAGGTAVHRLAALPLFSLVVGCGLAAALRRWIPTNAGPPREPSAGPARWVLNAALAVLLASYAGMVVFLALESRPHDISCSDGEVLELLRVTAASGGLQQDLRTYVTSLLQRASHRAERGDRGGAEADLRLSAWVGRQEAPMDQVRHGVLRAGTYMTLHELPMAERTLREAEKLHAGGLGTQDDGVSELGVSLAQLLRDERKAEGRARAVWLVKRGVIKLKLADADGARRDMKDAIVADPETACGHDSDLGDKANLGLVYFDLCIARFPDSPDLRVDRGLARYYAKDQRGAESDFRRALKLKQDCIEAAVSLATLLEESGKVAGALAVLDETLARSQGRRTDRVYADAMSMRRRLGSEGTR